MSHFTVLVIGDDVEGALAPYDEQLEQAPYVEYTREQLIQKSKDEIESYRLGIYAEYLKDIEAYKAKVIDNPKHLAYLEQEFPKMLLWSDEEHYQDQIKWYDKESIGANGEVYSTSNPNGYWDWYQIGGRWAGQITVKPGTTFDTPNFSWGWSEEEKQKAMQSLRTDSALLKDIDFDVMNADNIKDYKERYALLQQWNTLDNRTRFDRFFGSNEEIEFMTTGEPKTLEEYMDNFMPHPLSAYAYIYKGIWNSLGRMGWWGCSHDEMDRATWNREFSKFISSLEPDTRITFVDCHV